MVQGSEIGAHTPGPWRAELRPSRMWHIYGEPLRNSTGDRGAVAFTAATYSDAGRAKSEANARLIAASPTMFAYVQRRANDGDADAAAIVEAINARR